MSRLAAVERKIRSKSRVTNGHLFLETIDQRSLPARLFRDIYDQIVADLGGAKRLSELQTQITRRAAALSTLAVVLETKLAAGEEIDVGQFVLLTNALNRAAERLGMVRVARDVTPRLEDHFKRFRDRVKTVENGHAP